MAKLTGEQAREIRDRLIRQWEPRGRIAEDYGVCVSHIYRVLRNETHPDPDYDPAQLAVRTEDSPDSRRPTSALTRSQVEEVRALRLSQYVPVSELATRYKTTDSVIYGVLQNKTWTDRDYNPALLAPRIPQKGGAIRTQGVIYGLYCVCGCDSRVMYVGQTTQNPTMRLRAHQDSAIRYNRGEYYTRKCQWIREHGRENIRVRILQENPEEGLDAAEARWIRHLDTLDNGVNMATGGYSGAGRPGEANPGAKLSESQVREIIEKMASPGVTSYSLAKEYGVTKTLILKIDHGDLWPDLPRPHGTRVLNRNRKMTIDHDIAETIRARFEGGEKISAIANDLGVNWHVVGNVVKERSWVK